MSTNKGPKQSADGVATGTLLPHNTPRRQQVRPSQDVSEWLTRQERAFAEVVSRLRSSTRLTQESFYEEVRFINAKLCNPPLSDEAVLHIFHAAYGE
jgi:hypothetical protein